MNLTYQSQQLSLELPVLSAYDTYQDQTFVIDTGFTGVCVFSVSKTNPSISQKVFALDLLPDDQWVTLADGSRPQTLTGKIFLQFEGHIVEMPTIFIESVREDVPLLGMQFLELFHKRLLIDFPHNIFEME